MPTLQSIIDNLLPIIEGHQKTGEMCKERSQEHAYKLVMETGLGWGEDKKNAEYHLKQCAQDGGRANAYAHAARSLEITLRDLCVLRDSMVAQPVEIPSAAAPSRCNTDGATVTVIPDSP